jgi:hypothetical protein
MAEELAKYLTKVDYCLFVLRSRYFRSDRDHAGYEEGIFDV